MGFDSSMSQGGPVPSNKNKYEENDSDHWDEEDSDQEEEENNKRRKSRRYDSDPDDDLLPKRIDPFNLSLRDLDSNIRSKRLPLFIDKEGFCISYLQYKKKDKKGRTIMLAIECNPFEDSPLPDMARFEKSEGYRHQAPKPIRVVDDERVVKKLNMMIIRIRFNSRQRQETDLVKSKRTEQTGEDKGDSESKERSLMEEKAFTYCISKDSNRGDDYDKNRRDDYENSYGCDDADVEFLDFNGKVIQMKWGEARKLSNSPLKKKGKKVKNYDLIKDVREAMSHLVLRYSFMKEMLPPDHISFSENR